MLPYFIFNGIDSRDMDIVVSKLSPVTRANKRVRDIEIVGSHGVLHEDLETYDNYTKTIECTIVTRGRNRTNEDLASWLVGRGELIESSDPSKVYRVFIKNQIEISNVIRSFSTFLIQFDTYPFKYSVSKAEEEVTISEATRVFNRGTYYSDPIIKIYGTGNITFSIDGNSYVVNGVDGYITINSEIQEVYKDSVNQNTKFIGVDFPKLQVGENNISFIGSVAKIEIYRNQRWL